MSLIKSEDTCAEFRRTLLTLLTFLNFTSIVDKRGSGFFPEEMSNDNRNKIVIALDTARVIAGIAVAVSITCKISNIRRTYTARAGRLPRECKSALNPADLDVSRPDVNKFAREAQLETHSRM